MWNGPARILNADGFAFEANGVGIDDANATE